MLEWLLDIGLVRFYLHRRLEWLSRALCETEMKPTQRDLDLTQAMMDLMELIRDDEDNVLCVNGVKRCTDGTILFRLMHDEKRYLMTLQHAPANPIEASHLN